jgi:hypothetical protein
MNSNFLKYLILTFFIVFISCKKDKETISDLIVGKWEWVKSVSAWTGQVSNPQTAGFSIKVEFTSAGLMKEYKNDTLSISTTYSIEINSTEPNRDFLIYNSGLRSQVYIDNDSLTINTAYVDGPVSYYVRLK